MSNDVENEKVMHYSMSTNTKAILDDERFANYQKAFLIDINSSEISPDSVFLSSNDSDFYCSVNRQRFIQVDKDHSYINLWTFEEELGDASFDISDQLKQKLSRTPHRRISIIQSSLIDGKYHCFAISEDKEVQEGPKLTTKKESFSMNRLIKSLKDPSSEPILNGLRIALKTLKDQTLGTEEKSERLQKFYQQTTACLAALPMWQGCSAEELDKSIDGIEQYLFSKINLMQLFCPCDTLDALHDSILIERLFQRSLEEMEESPIIDSSAFMNLSALDVSRTPVDKMACLVHICKILTETDASGSPTEDKSADQLLPSLINLCIQARPCHLISNIRFIQRFRNSARLAAGQEAYCLTNFQAILAHFMGGGDGELDAKRQQLNYSLTMEEISWNREKFVQNESSSTLALLPSNPEASRAEGPDVNAIISNATTLAFNELNLMATSVMSKITFVPRAISTAVADTFRGKQSIHASSSSISLESPEKILTTSSPLAAEKVSERNHELPINRSKSLDDHIMPKQITEVKEFLTLVNRKDTKAILVKKNKDNVKFKARTPGKLVTLVVHDAEKAEKLIKMLPPSLKPQFIKS